MFIIKPVDHVDIITTLKLASYYDVKLVVKTINPESTKAANFTLVVEMDRANPDDHLLAEKAFQMNFKQRTTNVCEVCKEKLFDFCPHRTFTKATGS